MAHAALQQARRCECSATNAAGRQLIELANGAWGQWAPYMCVGNARGQGGSRPDYVVMSEKVFRAAEVDIEEARHISNHCTMSVSFQVSATGLINVGWAMNCDHVCKPGGCGSRLMQKRIMRLHHAT
eukprot:1140750-Pelagomonas_calceolata.AAC.2